MPFPLFIPGNSKITKFNRKKILQHQKFVESFSRAFWVHPDPFISDDVCFSASFWWGFEKCSINWGNVNCNPDHGHHFPSSSMNVYGLAYLAWKRRWGLKQTWTRRFSKILWRISISDNRLSRNQGHGRDRSSVLQGSSEMCVSSCFIKWRMISSCFSSLGSDTIHLAQWKSEI